jgi:hypothetical protein
MLERDVLLPPLLAARFRRRMGSISGKNGKVVLKIEQTRGAGSARARLLKQIVEGKVGICRESPAKVRSPKIGAGTEYVILAFDGHWLVRIGCHRVIVHRSVS